MLSDFINQNLSWRIPKENWGGLEDWLTEVGAAGRWGAVLFVSKAEGSKTLGVILCFIHTPAAACTLTTLPNKRLKNSNEAPAVWGNKGLPSCPTEEVLSSTEEKKGNDHQEGRCEESSQGASCADWNEAVWLGRFARVLCKNCQRSEIRTWWNNLMLNMVLPVGLLGHH